jgi:hypothetical protein
MITEVKKPRDVFYMPQRLLVPLFQRPYVWSQEGQWEPLWDDVLRVADKLVLKQEVAPHFLGAVVLQQQAGEIGTLQVRSVIDGQQRLTTLQLLLDAVHEEVLSAGFESIAQQVRDLVENAEHFRREPEDRYKVWPTNRDRAAFNEVMSAISPIDYEALGNVQSTMVRAHKYFAHSAREWLNLDNQQEARANALVTTVSSYLQLVVIELLPDEDAQEIFETLNARGTPLTAADLIKNFVFQRLDVSPEKAEKAYHEYWREFETPFWEKKVSSGRVNYTRSSLFLNQWLIAQTAKNITAREVFTQFKRFVIDNGESMTELLTRIRDCAEKYQAFTEGASSTKGTLSRLELFVYRTSTLESEVFKPILIWLTDPALPEVPQDQFEKALESIESWYVRRVSVRAGGPGGSKAYNSVAVALLNDIRSGDRSQVGDLVERFLASRSSQNDYWPGDEELRNVIPTINIYRQARRARLRMTLEAIEDHLRGFDNPKSLAEQRISRGTCSIEHVLPQEWQSSWPGAEGDVRTLERDRCVHVLGNLTLVTQSLNSKVSNGPWGGVGGKREELKKYSVIHLNKDLVELGSPDWTEALIRKRSEQLVEQMIEIWPVPQGHVGNPENLSSRPHYRITVADLVAAGMFEPGQELVPRLSPYAEVKGSISSDGRIFVAGQAYETPSAAAKAITGADAVSGWWFWLVDPASNRTMRDVRSDYLSALSGGDMDSDTDD